MYSFNFMLPSLSTPFHSLQLKISNCALLWFLRHNIYIPPYETVYDYFVDEETGNFSLWEDRIDLRPRADVPSDSSYVALHQVSVCCFFSPRGLHSENLLPTLSYWRAPVWCQPFGFLHGAESSITGKAYISSVIVGALSTYRNLNVPLFLGACCRIKKGFEFQKLGI